MLTICFASRLEGQGGEIDDLGCPDSHRGGFSHHLIPMDNRLRSVQFESMLCEHGDAIYIIRSG